MPDPLQAARKHMQQEAANELLLLQAHHLQARIVAVILPIEADLAILEVDQTMIGDGDPVRIAAEIFKDMLGAAKRGLNVGGAMAPRARKTTKR